MPGVKELISIAVLVPLPDIFLIKMPSASYK